MIDLTSDHREVRSTPSCTLRGGLWSPPVGISTRNTESAAIAALQRLPDSSNRCGDWIITRSLNLRQSTIYNVLLVIELR